MRGVVVWKLVLLPALASAALAAPGIEADLYDKFVYLAPGDDPHNPEFVEHEMENEGVEVHVLLRFRFGLYGIGRLGELQPAVAGVILQLNDATRPTDEKNPFVVARLQRDANPDWFSDEPGVWLTRARTNENLERTIIFRLPGKGRYRVRITGLFNDNAIERRVPILTGVAEVRELPVETATEEQPLEEQPLEEEPLEEELATEVYEAVPIAPVMHPAAPCACPFCRRPLGRSYVRDRHGQHYHCSGCSGAVHVGRDGRRRYTALDNGRRREYEVDEKGRARGYTPPPPRPRVERDRRRRRSQEPVLRPLERGRPAPRTAREQGAARHVRPNRLATRPAVPPCAQRTSQPRTHVPPTQLRRIPIPPNRPAPRLRPTGIRTQVPRLWTPMRRR